MYKSNNSFRKGITKYRSPLRYPGGKSKAIKQILPLIPKFSSYREPLVGGGSLFVALKQLYPDRSYWINDLNYDLYLFWKYTQCDIDKFVEVLCKIKKEYVDGRVLYNDYKHNWESLSDFDRAVRFFVLNRITFSGAIDSGGYSQESFDRRFTDSSIHRLSELQFVINDVKITNLDYQEIINAPGDDVFIYLDSPYYSTTRSKLYGTKGDLHINFNHKRFADDVHRCNHQWLITYDDCPEVRDLFWFGNIIPWSFQYGMNNVKKEKAAIGQEVFITNYKIPNYSSTIQLSFTHLDNE